MPNAARIGDPIGHSPAMNWLIKGLLIGAAVGVAAVAIAGTGGLAAAAIIGGLAAGGAGVGELLSSMSWAPKEECGAIASGSTNVFFNHISAARAHVDSAICSKHSNPNPVIATGSATVSINKMPAARIDDKLACSAVITKGSSNIFIGGGTVQTDDIYPENLVPSWVHWALLAVGGAAAIILGGPIVGILGIAGAFGGGYAGNWLGGKIFGEGSDGQKWMMLGGSIIGGAVGTKGGMWFNKNYTIKVQGLGSNLGNVKIQARNAAVIEESQSAFGRASTAKEALPNTKELRAKTVASDGEKTLSGWKQPAKEGYGQATPEQVKANCEKIGHELEPHPYDKDFPGQYNASHAEKQLSILRPDEPIGVSKPVCTDCQNYFSKLAQSRGVDQVVTDPDGTWIFHSDGTITPP